MTVTASHLAGRTDRGHADDVQVVAERLGHGELAGRLAEHVVAGALVRKSVDDPVPFPVWWRVTDALRSAVLDAPATAAAEVAAAMTSLEAAVEGLGHAPARASVTGLEDARSVHRARVLVARLVFSTSATSPTLLHVRLARLRRALLAAAEAGQQVPPEAVGPPDRAVVGAVRAPGPAAAVVGRPPSARSPGAES
jgi:hypothetical protein